MSLNAPSSWTGRYVLLLVLLLGACQKHDVTANAATPSLAQERRAARPPIAACSLITRDEVGAVQKIAITDAKDSGGSTGEMLMSQCYYSAAESNKSVSLTVIQANPNDPSGPDTRKYWEDSFRRFAGSEEKGEQAEEKKEGGRPQGREEEEVKIPPKKISDVGEEAYWSGNRFGGVLYVLVKDVIVRISVGGPDNEQTKIDKSKVLAEKAIPRL